MKFRSFCVGFAIGAAVIAAIDPFPVAAQSGTPGANPPPASAPGHGPGVSGKGDGSGMGQDTSEAGTPKGAGDKGGPPADETVAPKMCDDGRQPVGGACPN